MFVQISLLSTDSIRDLLIWNISLNNLLELALRPLLLCLHLHSIQQVNIEGKFQIAPYRNIWFPFVSVELIRTIWPLDPTNRLHITDFLKSAYGPRPGRNSQGLLWTCNKLSALKWLSLTGALLRRRQLNSTKTSLSGLTRLPPYVDELITKTNWINGQKTFTMF